VAHLQRFVARGSFLWFRLLFDSFDKIVIGLAYDRLEPTPIVDRGLEDGDGVTMAADADLSAGARSDPEYGIHRRVRSAEQHHAMGEDPSKLIACNIERLHDPDMTPRFLRII
jgi:hypothetical protein